MNPYQEFLLCQQSFLYFAEKYVRINHHIHGLIPFALYDYHKKLLSLYEQNKYVISIKFRNSGISTFNVIYGLWLCMFQNVNVYYCCKTEGQAIHLGKIVNQTMLFFPEWFSPYMKKDTKTIKEFAVTNSRMTFGNVENAYDKSITHLFIDEAAFITNLDQKWKTLFPIITPSNIWVASTINGISNWFSETYDKAKKNQNSFVAYAPNYLENPENNNPEWIECTKKALGEIGWQQEVLGNFICE